MNLKVVLQNGILRKYYHLFTEKSYTEQGSPYHINQLLKLCTELSQLINKIDNFKFILYNQNSRIIFNNLDSRDEHLLTNDEIQKLLDNKEIYYVTNSTLIATFPVFYDNNTKPSFFLKTFQKSSGFLILIYSAPLVLMSLLSVSLILIMVHLHNSHTKTLTKQYENNVELQRVKEAFEQESTNKIKFLASVTHELRTPLNSIIGFAELIKNETFDTMDIVKEYVDDIYHAGAHLLSLINDILDFSKAEADNLTIEKVRFNLNKVVDSCINMLLPKFKEAEVNFKKKVSGTQLLLTTDSRRMRQVIINLLSNAIKFTPKGGLICMIVKENIEQNLLSIEFHDNGIGIMQQDICKVMSVFGQANSGYRNEGSGLGLPLSKKLVELMGGTFNIKSESQPGTIITLTFPYEEETCESSIDF